MLQNLYLIFETFSFLNIKQELLHQNFPMALVKDDRLE
jgi:hypothetical protein